MNRRQFATNTGVLLGILAVGEPALGQAPVADAGGTSTGPWDNPALAKFREWDPLWVEQCLKMSGDPWTSGVLPRKDVELISLAVIGAALAPLFAAPDVDQRAIVMVAFGVLMQAMSSFVAASYFGRAHQPAPHRERRAAL